LNEPHRPLTAPAQRVPRSPLPRPPVPYWRLSGFYFFYFALLGALYPYWPLYLQGEGFSPDQIGLLLAVPMATKIVAPNLWSWLADVTGRRLEIIRLGSLLGLICFLGVVFGSSFWWLLLVITGYSFFWNAVLPQQEVVTLDFLADFPERYSRLRVWGSVGFIIAVICAGYSFEQWGIGIFPLVGLSLLAGIFFSSLSIPQPPQKNHESHPQTLWQATRQPAVLAFLATGVLMQMAHGAYYSFFSIYMEALGYSRSTIGLLWSIGVVAEVIIFIFMHRLLVAFGVRAILIASLLLAALRWAAIGNGADWLWLLIAAQCLHAFSFGTFHAAAIDTIRRLFKADTQGSGQALYGAVSFGVGGAAGSYLAGVLWDAGATLVFNLATLLCLLAAVLAWYGFKDKRLG